jgi:heat shock protein HslJ
MRIALVALAFLAACTSLDQPASPTEPPSANYLSGTKWRRVDDANASPHNPTLEFDGARASGFTGCNRWFAAVIGDGADELRFGDVGTTRMACTAEPANAAERNFLAVLEATRHAHYDADALVLLDAQQNQLARFQADR